MPCFVYQICRSVNVTKLFPLLNKNSLKTIKLHKGFSNFTNINFKTKMASRLCSKLDDSMKASEFLDSFDYVLTDCDGVLWNEDVPIPGSIETIQALKNLGKQVLYVTNNSSKTREYFLKKCERLGFPATCDDIISTAYCTAVYLKAQNFQKKVYIVGCLGIGEELSNVNIPHLSVEPDPVPDNWLEWIKDLKLDPEVGAVIVGFDPYLSFPKITKAASYLRNPDVLFLATNRDEQVLKNNMVVPCTGVLVSAIETASARKATTIGKPEKHILDCLKHIHPDVNFSRSIMIGDRLDTDILLGTKHGIRTLLVLTGNDTLEGVQNLQRSSNVNDLELIPDYYLPCLGDLKNFIL